MANDRSNGNGRGRGKDKDRRGGGGGRHKKDERDNSSRGSQRREERDGNSRDHSQKRGERGNSRGNSQKKAERVQEREHRQTGKIVQRVTNGSALRVLQALNNPRVVAAIKANPNEHKELLGLIDSLRIRYSAGHVHESGSPVVTDDTPPGSPVTNDPTLEEDDSLELPCDVVASWEAQPAAHYDEMFDGDEVRLAYSEVQPIISEIERTSPARIDAYEKRSLRDFQQDNKLYHIPRMLSIAEHAELTSGVAQRAAAIQAFLQDYFAAGMDASCFKNGIIPQQVFRDILERNHEHGFAEVNAKLAGRWGFWYGPDLIRGPEGHMYVCEDNIGFVGGLGDLECARRSLLTAFPELAPAIRGDTPKNFYQSITNEYRSMVKSNERIVLLHYPNSITADNEEKRVIKLFKECGVDTVVLDNSNRRKGKGKGKGKSRQLVVNSDGAVELVVHKRANPGKGRGKETVERFPVGLVIIDAEAFDVDPKDSSVSRKIILDEATSWLEDLDERLASIAKMPEKKKAKKLPRVQRERDDLWAMLSAKKKPYGAIAKSLRVNRRRDFKETLEQGVDGILASYYAGQVQIINGPGYDFLGDKLFCMYVGQLIRYYLKQEPIIHEIPTFGFADKAGNLDGDLFNAVFDDPILQQYLVLKRVDGRGGDAVWVGPKIPRDEFESVREKIQAEPGAFIVQKYLALSVVDNQLVDLRNLANVTSSSVIVSDVLWGRGVPADNSNGKVNISDRGFEFAVCRGNN